MANVNEIWARLDSVIVWTGMTINGFAHHIGLSRAENLYQIKSGKNGLSRNLASRIVAAFPEISAGWLLTGEGSMFAPVEVGDGGIPFYEGDYVWQRLVDLSSIEPSSYISLPAIGACDCAVRCCDSAMAKDVSPGTIVFLKRIDPKLIIPGSLCVIVSANFVLLRRARFVSLSSTPSKQCELAEQGAEEKQEEQGVLRLEASNKSYDTVEVPLDSVIDVYRVVGSLNLF